MNRHAVRTSTDTRPSQPRHGPWSKRATGLVLLLASIVFIGAGMPILLFGGWWSLPGLILTVCGAAGMGYAFLFFIEAGDE